MWSVEILDDPLQAGIQEAFQTTRIISAQCTLRDLLIAVTGGDESCWVAFLEGGRAARVALADFVARYHLTADGCAQMNQNETAQDDQLRFRWESLSDSISSMAKRYGKSHTRRSAVLVPYMLERTDVWCSSDALHVQLRVFVETAQKTSLSTIGLLNDNSALVEATQHALQGLVSKMVSADISAKRLMNHVATAVLQERLRAQLTDLNAVAFVADGAILPRKSGASCAPMASPPAIPFSAPVDSPMNRTLEVSMGHLFSFLTNVPTSAPLTNGHVPEKDVVCLRGLLIPRGVSLIVGGGYHGKSTLLRTVAAGIYNKVPQDGREFCVTVTNAVTVRAEDGRYVNNCNISAFISNLPKPPGEQKPVDTCHFSTREASGSTSQATNVAEAIEMGCSAFLVDEDVSAANFMARDGRMRALVMDESITPLLYRVNGLYKSHGISTIVVVGGVGDWLDVPDAVILLNNYLCRDATHKARSISRQFSHGHVQYGGRGVVHRLEWEKSGTPHPRRPTDRFIQQMLQAGPIGIQLLEGHNALALLPASKHSNLPNQQMVQEYQQEEEDSHVTDMSRCEQLMGNKAQLYGCALCLIWVLQTAKRFPDLGIADLLNKLDETLDEAGFASIISSSSKNDDSTILSSWIDLLDSTGYAYRPRKFEVGQALTRLRGMELEVLPIEDDGSEAAAAAEAERKKKEFLEMWNSRRKNKLQDS